MTAPTARAGAADSARPAIAAVAAGAYFTGARLTAEAAQTIVATRSANSARTADTAVA